MWRNGEKISIHVFDTWMLISCFKNVLPHGEDLMVVPSVSMVTDQTSFTASVGLL